MTWAPNFQFWEPEGLPKIFLRQQPWFWFTQMMCYNVNIILLIRHVEENPAIFDIIDLMRTVSADYSQGNEAIFGENAGGWRGALSDD